MPRTYDPNDDDRRDADFSGDGDDHGDGEAGYREEWEVGEDADDPDNPLESDMDPDEDAEYHDSGDARQCPGCGITVYVADQNSCPRCGASMISERHKGFARPILGLGLVLVFSGALALVRC